MDSVLCAGGGGVVMRVKTCDACPYTPEDLAHNYDPSATTYCCGRCPAQGLLCIARGYYIREGEGKHPERTNWFKRQEARNEQDSPPL